MQNEEPIVINVEDGRVTITGKDGETVGVLSWGDGALSFEGSLRPSAFALFHHFLKPLVDEYLYQHASEEQGP